MTEHPYATGNTLTPGETADDDPFTEEAFCEKCKEYIEPIDDKCPVCGEDVS